MGAVNETQYVCLVDKDKDGNISRKCVLSVRYVPLTSKEEQLSGLKIWNKTDFKL